MLKYLRQYPKGQYVKGQYVKRQYVKMLKGNML